MRARLCNLMRIGLDFDNTIVDYDALFHRVALEQGVIPPELAVTKLAVREHLRAAQREEVWTAMQGTVYGSRMSEAVFYPGALAFFRWARGAGVALAIISHKTRHPFLGPQYDLHQAARDWVIANLVHEEQALIDPAEVYFELTKPDKLARIGALGCDFFIDDLPEILTAEAFPAATRRILFDPNGHHAPLAGVQTVAGWPMVSPLLERAWWTTP